MEQNKALFKKIKECNKDAPITLKILPGYHCQGSSEVDKNGEFPIIKELISGILIYKYNIDTITKLDII